jgi:hypothetical protein
MASPRELLDRLAARDATSYPFLSLYLDARSGPQGRDQFDRFVRRALKARAQTFEVRSPDRESYDHDAARIERYLESEVRPRANGIALFACAAQGVFEATQLDVAFPGHMLVVGPGPHVLPLARVLDEHPSHAAVVADTHLARLFVFSLGTSVRHEAVESPKVPRPAMGGWSQIRYQRHADHSHLLHAKAVVEALDQIVREDGARHLILAGDDVILPLLQEQLPARLRERVIAALHLDMRATDHDVMQEAERAFAEYRVRRDRQRAASLTDRALARDQAVLGVEPVLEALERGQVHELVLSAGAHAFASNVPEPLVPACERTVIDLPVNGTRDARVTAVVGNELVVRARRTAAGVACVGDPSLLADVGHVGAHLRFSAA